MFPDNARANFEAWAPPGQRWSPWAKPALFTYATRMDVLLLPTWPQDQASVLPKADGRQAVVVDLPALQSLSCAMALVPRGFALVPLYNATIGEGREVVDVHPLILGLVRCASRLAQSPPAPDAPPAFLLDSGRCDGDALPGEFDNRWMVFPQDLPSARAFKEAGVNSVIVIRNDDRMKPDLRAVLRLWKREGIASELLVPSTGERRSLDHDTSLFEVLSDHVAMLIHGLRENSAGGFGGTVPFPSSTSGGFA